MALIVCPECNNKISEYASFCPHCGCPMKKIKELLEIRKKEAEKNLNFYEKRSVDEKAIIDFVKDELTNLFRPICVGNSKYKYAIGTMVDGEFTTHCWFSNGGNGELLFKFYSNGNHLRYVSYKITNNNQKAILVDLKKLFEDKKPIQIVKSQTRAIKDVHQIVDNDTKRVNTFCQTLMKYLNKESVECSDSKKAYMNKIKKYFVDNVKTTKVYDGVNTFFGSRFLNESVNRSYHSLEETKFIYSNYVTNEICDFIKRYETIFNKQIIIDIYKFRKEIYEMHKLGSICIDRSSNLVSDVFSYIPHSSLDEIIENIKNMENE